MRSASFLLAAALVPLLGVACSFDTPEPLMSGLGDAPGAGGSAWAVAGQSGAAGGAGGFDQTGTGGYGETPPGVGGIGGGSACSGFDGGGGYGGGIFASAPGQCASAQDFLVPRAKLTGDYTYFPGAAVGGVSTPKTFSFENVGCAQITALDFVVTDAENYEIVGKTCGDQMSAGNPPCTVDVVFTPKVASCKVEAALVARTHGVPVAATNLEGDSLF